MFPFATNSRVLFLYRVGQQTGNPYCFSTNWAEAYSNGDCIC